MIHRFVDSVVLTSPPDGIPYMASSSGPVYEIWRGGLGTTPVKLTAATPGTVPGDVILSPDLFEAAYSAVNSGELQVRVVQMDDTNDELVVGHSVFNTNLTASPSWNPAGTKLVYIMGGASSGDPLTIRTINRDGSGETTLWTSTTSYGDPVYVKWSPSGDYIVWSIQRVLVGSAPELWRMEDDGSNPTKIYTSPRNDLLQLGEYMGWAFQNGADVIGWCEFNADDSKRWRKINVDGTGLTTILNDGQNWANIGANSRSWLPDNSAMIGLLNVGGSPAYRLYKIAANGSGATALSPSEVSYFGTFGQYKYVPCIVRGRIYWVDTNQPAYNLVSVLPDGSDYTIDHDLDADGLIWRGFILRGTN